MTHRKIELPMIKNLKYNLLISVILPVLFVTAAHAKPHTVFQYSVLNSLMSGVFEGDMPMSELLKNGDFGIGTFDRLDGEMIIVDGKVYQARSDGMVIERNDNVKVPFAQLCSFEPQEHFIISDAISLESVKKLMNVKLHSENIMYAVKITGRFNYVKTRSVPKQSEPYRPLAVVIKEQSVFELNNVEGQVIGFRQPDYIREINVPGYHFHFINKSKTAGGHVLEINIASAEVMLDSIYEYNVKFSNGSSFLNKDLSGDFQYKP